MKYVLKKDVVIPAGKVVELVPFGSVKSFGSDNYDCVIGLGNDDYVDIVFSIERDDPTFDEYFVELR